MISKDNINSIPDKVGLYFLFDKDKQIVYVGISKNIRKRIRKHRNKEFYYIRYSLIEDKEFRLKREKRLIHEIKPKYNNKSIYYEYRQTPHLIDILFNLDKIKKDYEKYLIKLEKESNDWMMNILKKEEDDESP